MSLRIIPIGYKEACAYIALHHRHHEPPHGYKFAIGCIDESEKLVGVATIGQPVARGNDDGLTAEVTRLCTDGTKNAPSMLYSAAWRACRGMGYIRLGTYILLEEPGTSVKAAGWKLLYKTKGGSWNTPSRPRIDKAPLAQKTYWQIGEPKVVSTIEDILADEAQDISEVTVDDLR